HPPLADVRTVAFSRVFLGNIRQTANHTLAARRLLTRRTIAWFHRIDHAANFSLQRINMLLTSNLLNARKHLCQLTDIPRQTLIFQLSSRSTSANITWIAA